MPPPERTNRFNNPRGPGGPRPSGRPGGRPPPRDRGGPPRHAGPPRPPRGMPGNIQIIFEDHDLIVIDKPPGLPDALPPHDHGASALSHAWKMLGPRTSPRLVNPLGKFTSGVLVIGKCPPAAHWAERALRDRKAKVFYHALVAGDPPADEGTIQSHLHLGTRGVVESIKDGKIVGDARRAVTHYRVLHRGDGIAVLQLRAETDHPGQLRAHMADIGCPIVGDRTHASSRDDLERLGLHLHELVFRDPKKGTNYRVKSPTPESFWKAAGGTPPPAARIADTRTPVRTPEGWEHVAQWYDDLLEGKGAGGTKGSEHHDAVVHPGVLRLVDAQPGQRLLDIACGQGALTRRFAELYAGDDRLDIVGVDASPALIDAARAHEGDTSTYTTGDARDLGTLDLEPFDHAVCTLALMNIEPIEPVFAGASELLKPGGSLVVVVLHPAFRIPRHTTWGWVESKEGKTTQFRRIDAYLSHKAVEIVMNPGEAAAGKAKVTTTTHHRPISAYAGAGVRTGLVVDAIEEWTTTRTSEPGPRAAAENLARTEIPMFLAMRFRKPV